MHKRILKRDCSRDLKRDHNSIYTTLYHRNQPVCAVKLDREICNIIVLLNEQECYTTRYFYPFCFKY